jgi:hypothetical protein
MLRDSEIRERLGSQIFMGSQIRVRRFNGFCSCVFLNVCRFFLLWVCGFVYGFFIWIRIFLWVLRFQFAYLGSQILDSQIRVRSFVRVCRFFMG